MKTFSMEQLAGTLIEYNQNNTDRVRGMRGLQKDREGTLTLLLTVVVVVVIVAAIIDVN